MDGAARHGHRRASRPGAGDRLRSLSVPLLQVLQANPALV